MKRVCAALAAVLLSVSGHAQEQVAEDAYDEAVAARLDGKPGEAVRLLEPLIAAEPSNSDAQVQLGYAYLALGQMDRAERAFEAALAFAPDYDDAKLGLARIAQRRGDVQEASRRLRTVAPGTADASVLREQLRADPRSERWRLDIDGAYATIEGPSSDWREVALQVRHRPSGRIAFTGRLERLDRFARVDTYGEALIERTIGERGHAYLLLGATPNADFRPRWQAGTGGSIRVRNGGDATVLTLDLRHAEFLTGEIQTATPGIEQYIFDGRAWLTGRWINLFSENGRHVSGYLLRADVQAADDLRVFAGLSDAPDTSEGVVIDTRSYFAGLSLNLSEQLTGRFSVATEEADTGADRTQVGLGVGLRF